MQKSRKTAANPPMRLLRMSMALIAVLLQPVLDILALNLFNPLMRALGIKDAWASMRRMTKRQFYAQVLAMLGVGFSALMIWNGLIVLTGSESPIVVVLSGSMEPATFRGDLLFLTNFPPAWDPIRVGEICVFKVRGRDIPIVHRIHTVHEDRHTGKIKFLTKGDNNNVDDRGLYAQGQMWLSPEEIVGRARLFAPYVGMVTIVMNDYPILKFVLLGLLALYVLVKRE